MNNNLNVRRSDGGDSVKMRLVAVVAPMCRSTTTTTTTCGSDETNANQSKIQNVRPSDGNAVAVCENHHNSKTSIQNLLSSSAVNNHSFSACQDVYNSIITSSSSSSNDQSQTIVESTDSSDNLRMITGLYDEISLTNDNDISRSNTTSVDVNSLLLTSCQTKKNKKHERPTTTLSPNALLSSSSSLSTLNSLCLRRDVDGCFDAAVLCCNFYFGRMNNSEAKSRLHCRPVGTFLLRDSSDDRFRYSLSVKTSRGTTSIRIAETSSRLFRLDSDPHEQNRMMTFSSVLELIEFYFVEGSSSSLNDGKSEKHCVFLESNGRSDIPMVLRKALELTPASLGHVCRTRLNRLLPSVKERLRLVDGLELDETRKKSIKNFLLEYPFRV